MLEIQSKAASPGSCLCPPPWRLFSLISYLLFVIMKCVLFPSSIEGKKIKTCCRFVSRGFPKKSPHLILISGSDEGPWQRERRFCISTAEPLWMTRASHSFLTPLHCWHPFQVTSPDCLLDMSDNVYCSPVMKGIRKKRDGTAREMCSLGWKNTHAPHQMMPYGLCFDVMKNKWWPSSTSVASLLMKTHKKEWVAPAGVVWQHDSPALRWHWAAQGCF